MKIMLYLALALLLGGCGVIPEAAIGAGASILGSTLLDGVSAGKRVVAEDLAAKARWKTQHDTRTIKAIDACEDFVEDVQDKLGKDLLKATVIDMGKIKEIIALPFLCLDWSVENQPDLAVERLAEGIRRARASSPEPLPASIPPQ